MNIALIDRMGAWRHMAVTHLPVRVPQIQPMSMSVYDVAESLTRPTFETVDFSDSGMVDESGLVIATPDGKDVPLGKYPHPIYRRGRKIWAEVWLSDAERFASRLPNDALISEIAAGPLKQFAQQGSRIVEIDRLEMIEKREPFTSCFRVYAEERIPVHQSVTA